MEIKLNLEIKLGKSWYHCYNSYIQVNGMYYRGSDKDYYPIRYVKGEGWIIAGDKLGEGKLLDTLVEEGEDLERQFSQSRSYGRSYNSDHDLLSEAYTDAYGEWCN